MRKSWRIRSWWRIIICLYLLCGIFSSISSSYYLWSVWSNAGSNSCVFNPFSFNTPSLIFVQGFGLIYLHSLYMSYSINFPDSRSTGGYAAPLMREITCSNTTWHSDLIYARFFWGLQEDSEEISSLPHPSVKWWSDVSVENYEEMNSGILVLSSLFHPCRYSKAI